MWNQSQKHIFTFEDQEVLESMLVYYLLQAEEIRDQIEEASTSSLEETVMDTCDLKKLAFEEVVKRWKEEENAMEAKCKASFCSLYIFTNFQYPGLIC